MSLITGPTQLFNIDTTSNSTVQQHPLGTKGVGLDGREFRYCLAGGTTLVPGKLQAGPAVVANHQNLAVQAAAAVGALTVSVTLGATATTASQYAEGLLVVNNTPGQGYAYRIKSNSVTVASGTATITLDAQDAILVALTTSSKVCLIPNRFNGVVVMPATAAAEPVGVAVQAVTNANFGWVQVHGPASCLADGATTLGGSLVASAAVAGALKTAVAGGPYVGFALQAGVDTEYRTVFLTMN